jgi:hypothetical protein
MSGAALVAAVIAYIAGPAFIGTLQRDWDYVLTVILHIGTFSAILWFLWL